MIFLSKNHVTPAAETLSCTFEDYPIFTFLFPEKLKRKEKLLALFVGLGRYGLRYGYVHASSQNFEGVAIWLNSEVMKMTLISYIRCGFLKVLRKVGLKYTMRYLKLLDFMGELHDKHMSEPHWHLAFLGVRPEHQRKGYGTLLMDEMLNYSKNDNWPYYLETAEEKNIDFYEKFGFKLVESAKLPESEVDHFCMVKRSAK